VFDCAGSRRSGRAVCKCLERSFLLAGREMNPNELSTLHEFRVTRVVMRLNVAEEPAFAQDVIDGNDPGGFLVVAERRGRRDAEIPEPRGIMSRHQLKCSLVDAVPPDFAVVRLVANVFLKEDRTARCDRHVVEHVAGLGAVQQARNGAAKFGVRNVSESEAIEAAVADLGAHAIFDLVIAVGGDEVVVTRVAQVPVAVFGAEELGGVLGVAQGLQPGSGEARDVAQILQAKGAVDGSVAVLTSGPGFVGNQPVDSDDIKVISFALAGETGAFNDIASGLFLANPKIDLTGSAVVHTGSDRDALRKWVGEIVFPLEQAAVRHFVRGARLVARDVRVVGNDHVPLAAEVDPSLQPEIAAALTEVAKPLDSSPVWKMRASVP
jgi:hypothetical protein